MKGVMLMPTNGLPDSTVFVITCSQGEYSDRNEYVVTVLSNRKTAEAFVEMADRHVRELDTALQLHSVETWAYQAAASPDPEDYQQVIAEPYEIEEAKALVAAGKLPPPHPLDPDFMPYNLDSTRYFMEQAELDRPELLEALQAQLRR